MEKYTWKVKLVSGAWEAVEAHFFEGISDGPLIFYDDADDKSLVVAKVAAGQWIMVERVSDSNSTEGPVSKNQQRREDCILVLKAGGQTISHFAAMLAAKTLIEEAIADHQEWENDPATKEMNKKIDKVMNSKES